jgi:hypothetical protein
MRFWPIALVSLAACQPDTRDLARDTMSRAAAYLWRQQGEDGGWHSETYGLLRSGQSLTPFVLDALLDAPAYIGQAETAGIRRAVAFLTTHVDADGALGRADPALEDYPNYATGLASTVMGRLGADVDVLATIGGRLLRQQYQEADGWPVEHPAHGAWGMGGEPPTPPDAGHLDLSMTRYVLEGLAYQPRDGRAEAHVRALRFLARLQGEDGGFFFSTVMTDKNKAGATAQGRFRSYGTATADGVLALLAAQVAPGDARVVRARDWLVRHHRVDRVPGFGDDDTSGWAASMVHYYRAASARAFVALDVAEAPAGVDWRAAMRAAYAREQRADGSFSNGATLMKEDDPLVATALAVKALAAAR